MYPIEFKLQRLDPLIDIKFSKSVEERNEGKHIQSCQKSKRKRKKKNRSK